MHHRIKRLIEETNDAYDICAVSEHINADYAEFASLSISEFKDALSNPELTRRQLVKMLRKGNHKHKNISPKSCWATFLAHYINTVSNGNVHAISMRKSWARESSVGRH